MSVTKIEQYIFLFTRRRKRLCIVTTFFIALLFVFYQFLIHHIVSNSAPFPKKAYSMGNQKLVLGTHVKEKQFYTSNDGKFTCFKSGETIDFNKVNDNYCDCADSTDEPGTNACPDGTFYCSDTSLDKRYPKMVPSTKVNDGICDCCDGSEEYENNNLLNNFDNQLPSQRRYIDATKRLHSLPSKSLEQNV